MFDVLGPVEFEKHKSKFPPHLASNEREDFSSYEDHSKVISLPSYGVWWLNIPFCIEKGLKTTADVSEWIKNNMADWEPHEITFSLPDWMRYTDGKWVVARGHSVKPLFKWAENGSPFIKADVGDFKVTFSVRRSVAELSKVVVREIPGEFTVINSWRYVPEDLMFHSLKKERTKLYFGMELEMSSKIEPGDLQYIVTEVEPKQKPFFYFKSDSSVGGIYDYRYELVTMPCTPRFLRKNLRLFFRKLEEYIKKHHPNTTMSDWIDVNTNASNGLHIHLSKDAFRGSVHGDRLWRNKFGSIWNQWDSKNLAFLHKLGKRVSTDNHYYKPHRNMRDRTLNYRLREGATCYEHEDRYAACRETRQTVEVRIFQGMVDLRHILYCINLTVAMFEYSRNMPISALNRDWSQHFLNYLSKRPEHRALYKEIQRCA